MNIKISLRNLIKNAPDLIPDHYKRRLNEKGPYQINDQTFIDIANGHLLPAKTITALKDQAHEDAKDRLPGARTAYRSIKRVISYLKQPKSGNKEVGDLNELAPALKEVIGITSPKRHWLYREMGDGALCPAYVANIEFKPRRGRDEPAHVDITLVWTDRSKMNTSTISFYRSAISKLMDDSDAVGSGIQDISASLEGDMDKDAEERQEKAKTKKVKRSIIDILAAKKLSLESDELYETYTASVPKYATLASKSGMVVTVEGPGFYVQPYKSYRDNVEYNVTTKDCDEDGVPAEMVLDDENPEKVSFKSSGGFWDFDFEKEESSYDVPRFWETTSYSIPFHPYLLMFDLRRQSHVWAHSEKVTPREYEKGIIDKLVLPPEDKLFLNMLMNSTKVKMDDIVSGKTGGVFVMSEGKPGTGKTLTAEVNAEAMQKPLYTVQCSQLGINPEQIEERLKRVLSRAQRWNAVLLLDEADVYVRSRGTDVQHNAIVGVLLRVIERYSGLLFMTTNLEDIDDAILSRATAHMIYKAPTPELLKKIWLVLSKQFEINLSDKDCQNLTETWPKAVGRDVKNLLKLSKMAMETGGDKSSAVEVVKKVSRYLDMESKGGLPKGR